MKDTSKTLEQAIISDALDFIAENAANLKASEHRQWMLDQILHTLTGTNKAYRQWVDAYNESTGELWGVGEAP